MTDFAELFTDADAAVAKQEIEDFLRANVKDWKPSSGNLDDWINTAIGRLWATLMRQASSMGVAALSGIGQIAGVTPILPAPASASSTWTAIDDAGYTVEDGTEVKIPVTGSEARGFVVVGDVEIPPGETATAAGAVLLQAIEPGAAGNGLSAAPTPISNRTGFVDTIALVGVSSGGVDAEDEDAYLARLVEALQLISSSLVLPRDFEIDARALPGIARNLCIPAWDAEAEAETPLCVTEVPLDSAGLACAAPVKEALAARRATQLLSGINHFIADPTHTAVDVAAEFTTLPGHDPATVEAAAQQALQAYLSPANAGGATEGEATGWSPVTAIYTNELIGLLDRVPGLDRVTAVKIAKSGDTLKVQASVALPGLAPLPEPDTIEVSAV